MDGTARDGRPEGDGGPATARLRDWVERSGLSLRALAVRSGVHHSTLSRILAGKMAPSPRVLVALAPHLGVTTEAALTLAEGAPPGEVPLWALPAGVGPDQFRAALDAMVALAAGPEVEPLIRAGFAAKRSALAHSGMAGPALIRLDRLYDMYTGRDGQTLPSALRRRVAGALLYFVLSVDTIPDDLYPVGYLDDAWVAELVWREVEAHLRTNPQPHGGPTGGTEPSG